MKKRKIMEKNMMPMKKNIQRLIIIKKITWDHPIMMKNKKMKMMLKMTMEKKKVCNKAILILIQNKKIKHQKKDLNKLNKI